MNKLERIATEIILEWATDIEYSYIREHEAEYEYDLTDDEIDQVDTLVQTAKVSVSW